MSNVVARSLIHHRLLFVNFSGSIRARKFSTSPIPYCLHQNQLISLLLVKQPPLYCSPRLLFSSQTHGGRRRAEDLQERNRRMALYALSVVIGFLGLTYASVPLYKVFCQMTGFGGTTQRASVTKAETVEPVHDGRLVRVTFDGNVSDMMPWSFKAQQQDVKVVPGETALAFYTAKNNSPKNITGVATYNVHPPLAGIHFNKIQCFCFEEQRLRAGEEIDMPVFFFIDPEFLEDPAMDSVNNITLSYTFFKTGEDEISLQDEDEDDEDGDEEDEED